MFGLASSDGDIDLLIGNVGPNEGFLNDGAGVFYSSTYLGGNDGTFVVATGDIDLGADCGLNSEQIRALLLVTLGPLCGRWRPRPPVRQS